MKRNPRIVIVGAGIVGLAVGRALRQRIPSAEITILEKEASAGQHQSTHNSGVLHAGLYYRPGSSRAHLAVRGIRMMIQYCRERGIAHEICGKLVVAADAVEVGRLRKLQERGTANGLAGLQWLSEAAIKEREPNVRAVAALLVPEEGIVDYAAVIRALTIELAATGTKVVTGARVERLTGQGMGWLVSAVPLQGGAPFESHFDFLVNCAGLHSDRIARLTGESHATRIVPFRGDYWMLSREKSHLVRHLVYPVPDPSFPFLGVHFTRRIQGGVECGPNAVLAFDREGYRKAALSLRDARDSLLFPGLWRFAARYPVAVALELWRSLSRQRFAASLRRLVPAVEANDLEPGPCGVRAQAMRPDGTLVDDFDFVARRNALHVINAPSPAATASLAIGHVIAQQVTDLIA